MTKTKFLGETFDLIETIKIEKGNLFLADLHLKRIQLSAKHFHFTFNPNILKIKPKKQDGILRIVLSSNGDFKEEYLPLHQATTSLIALSKYPVQSSNKFLYHKTTFRPWYKNTTEKINRGLVYDEIFINEKGELTEGSRCNIVIDINHELFTPPIECGLLNGVYREHLLTTKKCQEKKLYVSDLKNAQHIYLINSVRGIKEVFLS